MTIDEQIAILQAIKDGKKIQGRKWSAALIDWETITSTKPVLNFQDYEYRLVREPEVIYVHKYASLQKASYGQYGTFYTDLRMIADACIRKFVEVIE